MSGFVEDDEDHFTIPYCGCVLTDSALIGRYMDGDATIEDLVASHKCTAKSIYWDERGVLHMTGTAGGPDYSITTDVSLRPAAIPRGSWVDYDGTVYGCFGKIGPKPD